MRPKWYIWGYLMASGQLAAGLILGIYAARIELWLLFVIGFVLGMLSTGLMLRLLRKVTEDS